MRLRLQNRRGAVVVLVGIMIVALMLLGAIALEASRLFAAKNEMQTVSDAAALAAAVQLLGPDSTTAGDTATAYARRNEVQNASVDSVRVEYGAWSPALSEFIAGGSPVDAVRIVAVHRVPLGFARLLGDSTVRMTSTATAWSAAPISESPCTKPIAVPYLKLLEVLDNGPIDPDRNLTEDDIRHLRELSLSEREVEFHYGHKGAPEDVTPDEDDWDEWFPIDIDSTWRKGQAGGMDRPSDVGGGSFQQYLNGDRCSRSVRPGDVVRTEPGDKKNAMRNGLQDLCEGAPLEGTFYFDGTYWACYVGGELAPIPLKLAFWNGYDVDWTESQSRASLEIKMLGSLLLTHFRDADDLDIHQGAKLYGRFEMKQDFGVVGESPTTLVRPVLVQ